MTRFNINKIHSSSIICCYYKEIQLDFKWNTDYEDTQKDKTEENMIISKKLHLQEGNNNFLKNI